MNYKEKQTLSLSYYILIFAYLFLYSEDREHAQGRGTNLTPRSNIGTHLTSLKDTSSFCPLTTARKRQKHESAIVRNEFQFSAKDSSHNHTDVPPPPSVVLTVDSLFEDDLTV